MAFHLNTRYYEIQGKREEQVYGRLVEMLLKTRLRMKLESAPGSTDEDVNAYLAGLLTAYLDPVYLSSISEVLSRYDEEIFQAVSKTEDRYRAYWIYKVNADDLLVSLGVFHHIWQEKQAEVLRMKRYYSHACECNRRIYRKPTALADIHTKLASGTERYLSILSAMRSTYFHFSYRLHENEMAELQEQVRELEKKIPYQQVQDEFLDLYSRWLKGERDGAILQRLLTLVNQLKVMEPSFEAEKFLSRIQEP
ncbi:MAG: hypothetical protein NC910_04250 [Candidatus Omnitrophica bacterium]|nr:hypothetical protein [Candidatus Omnitrophota bacterium]